MLTIVQLSSLYEAICHMFREYKTMVTLDGKYNVKVREPNSPVASVDRAMEVSVDPSVNFIVDYDFTKPKVTP